MSGQLLDFVAAERIRLLSLRSTHAFLACSFVIAVAAASLLCAKVNIRPSFRSSYPSVNDVFNADTGSLLMTVAGCFGAASVTGEYASGLIRTTFTATPARGRVLLAKALALTGVAGIVGADATLSAILVSQVILSHGHYRGALSQPGGLQAAVAFALLMPLGAIVGLGIGALLRRPVTAVATVVIVLALLPGLPGLTAPSARQLTAYGAWSVLAGQPDGGTAASAGQSWLVLCAWPTIIFTLAVLAVRRRDV
jgi:ABC-2 type transport system permease protein